MGKASRQKGCVAEREVAALLERWWSQLEPGCRFVRTPSSGNPSVPDRRPRGSCGIAGLWALPRHTQPWSALGRWFTAHSSLTGPDRDPTPNVSTSREPGG